MVIQVVGEVEFIGGPIDGHKCLRKFPPDPFLPVKIDSTSLAGRLFSYLTRLFARRIRASLIRLAVYELDWDGSPACLSVLRYSSRDEKAIAQPRWSRHIRSTNQQNNLQRGATLC